MHGDQAQIVTLLEMAAEGRKEYAQGLFDTDNPELVRMKSVLEHEEATFRQAARIAGGDIHSLHGALPSRMWERGEKILDADPEVHPADVPLPTAGVIQAWAEHLREMHGSIDADEVDAETGERLASIEDVKRWHAIDHQLGQFRSHIPHTHSELTARMVDGALRFSESDLARNLEGNAAGAAISALLDVLRDAGVIQFDFSGGTIHAGSGFGIAANEVQEKVQAKIPGIRL